MKCLNAASGELELKFVEAANKLHEKETFLPAAEKHLDQSRKFLNTIAVLQDIKSEKIDLFKLEILQQ